MNRFHRIAIAVAVAAAAAAPLAAQQFSESYNFFKAVRARDGAKAEEIVANPSSTAINTRDPSTGEGALHILVRGRDLNWLAFMLGHGARPDLQMDDGSTPLSIAAQIGWVEGADQLLIRGANVDLPNSQGETPLILAVQNRHIPMIRLLLQRGADPNRTDNATGYSALDYARRDRRDADIARLLETAPPPRRSNVAGPNP